VSIQTPSQQVFIFIGLGGESAVNIKANMTPKELIFEELSSLMPELVPMPGLVAVTRLRKRTERNGEATMLENAETRCELLQAQVEELEEQLATVTAVNERLQSDAAEHIESLSGTVSNLNQIAADLHQEKEEFRAANEELAEANANQRQRIVKLEVQNKRQQAALRPFKNFSDFGFRADANGKWFIVPAEIVLVASTAAALGEGE
jgi:hypothetical protein